MDIPPHQPIDLRRRALKGRMDRTNVGTGIIAGMQASEERGSSKIDYSVIPWSDCFDECRSVPIPNTSKTFNVYLAGNSGPLFYCLHGAGQSSLTFAKMSKLIKESGGRVMACDFRGHGNTRTDNDSDLSADTLCNDSVDVYNAVFSENCPPTVIVGHSLGGAIATKIAVNSLIAAVQGLVVLDVVEGTALASLHAMSTFLDSRPSRFISLEKGIEWCLKSHTVRSTESARMSFADQMQQVEKDDVSYYTWKVDLGPSEKYWEGWFKDLSKQFLASRVPKILILAGTDRLDKDLMIGQMQGKFQLQIVYNAGHQIMEDQADQVGDSLLTFAKRNGIGFESPIAKVYIPIP